jgi:hypothetical protein
LFRAAEFDAGAAQGFGGGESGACQIVGAGLEMEGELVMHFALKATASDEFPEEGDHVRPR